MRQARFTAPRNPANAEYYAPATPYEVSQANRRIYEFALSPLKVCYPAEPRKKGRFKFSPERAESLRRSGDKLGRLAKARRAQEEADRLERGRRLRERVARERRTLARSA